MNGVFEEGTSVLEIGAVTTITGIVLVFSMLILLVFVLWIFGVCASAATNKSKKRVIDVRTEPVPQLVSSPVVEPAVTPTVSESVDDGLNNEVVAAISAAIAVMYSGSGKRPVIKSVKRAAGRRSAWASAGIADNTRVF